MDLKNIQLLSNNKVSKSIKSENPSFILENQCNLCDKVFGSKDILKIHLKTVHIDSNKKILPKLIECDICKKVFTLKYLYKRHLIAKHASTSLVKKEESEIRLAGVNVTIRKFKCKECEKFFSGRHRLKIHVDSVHKGLKPFPCNYCNKTFTRKDVAKFLQATIHTEKPNFQCDHCNKTFSQRMSYKCHMIRVHFKTKTNKCSICDKLFTTDVDLRVCTYECSQPWTKSSL